MMQIRQPKDVEGRPIRRGATVRVLAIPDLSGMSARGRRETRRVFAHIRGTYRRVAGFNALGQAELSFRIRRGPDAGLHTVWIEPALLRVRRRRA
jgi:hypothetical protein